MSDTDGHMMPDSDNLMHTQAEDPKKISARKFFDVRSKTGMNRTEFAQWLGIPYRTMQDWERGVACMPDYILKLVDYKVTNELAKGNLRESVIDNLQKKKQGIEKSAPDNHIKRQKEASR